MQDVVVVKTYNKLYLDCLVLGLLCLRQLLPETGKLSLSRRQVSALLGKLLLQLGGCVFNHLHITACSAMQSWIGSHAVAWADFDSDSCTPQSTVTGMLAGLPGCCHKV